MNPLALEHPYVKNDTTTLYALDAIQCDSTNLRATRDIRERLVRIFEFPEYAEEWEKLQRKTEQLLLADDNGSVNPGDRRALYYLTRVLKPRSMLEIGTHLGGSTLHIALAQQENGFGNLVTVDAKDVNDGQEKRWKTFGSIFSPAQMLQQVGCRDHVNFVTETSSNFFTKGVTQYDLIFLDGNHSASVVYQDIAGALRHLQDGGLILLHDYFPNLEPLWSDGSVIPGPALAVERLLRENVAIAVEPLGALPWPTKLGSTVTSLALLGAADPCAEPADPPKSNL